MTGKHGPCQGCCLQSCAGPSTKNSREPAIGVISNLREPHIGARIRLAYAACFCQVPQVSDSHHKQLSMRINAHPPRWPRSELRFAWRRTGGTSTPTTCWPKRPSPRFDPRYARPTNDIRQRRTRPYPACPTRRWTCWLRSHSPSPRSHADGVRIGTRKSAV